MKINSIALLVCLALLRTPFSYAVSGRLVSGTDDKKDSSSSVSLPDAPDAALIEESRMGGSKRGFARNTRLRLETPPFSQIAIGFTSGISGMGVQVATALATKINLRGQASFLNLNPVVVEEGFPIDGKVRLRTVSAAIDVFPYRNTFHISPGVTIYNGNRMTATTNIAPGQHFEINDIDYTSDLTDPVHGFFDVSLGKRLAPSLTMGFGNMLLRSTNWSLQSDFGVQFVGRPGFILNMMGTACDVADGCTRIQDDPSTVSNLQQEQAEVNREIQPLRFYPIMNIALGYRFGHKTSTTYWR